MSLHESPLSPFSTLPEGLPRACVLAALAVILGASCGKGGPPPVTSEIVQARDRAAEYGLWEKDGWVDAQRTLEPIVAKNDAAAEDLLRMACATLGTGAVEEALPYLDRAEKVDANNPVLRWCRYRVARIQYDNETALRELREIRQLVPDDVPSRLALGMVLSDLAMDEPDSGHADEAVQVLEDFLAIPPEVSGSWRVTALFRLSSLLARLGEEERAEPYFAEYKRFGDEGVESPGEPEHQPGSLGDIPPHSPDAFAIDTPVAPAALTLADIATPAGTRGMLLVHLGPDPEPAAMPGGPAGEELWRWQRDVPSLVTFGSSGVQTHARENGGWSAPHSLMDEPVLDAIPFDRGNKSTEPTSFRWRRDGDPGMDFVVAVEQGSGCELRLLEELNGEWTLHEPFFSSPSGLERGHLVPADLDHEGDLDLIVGTTTSVHVLRNDDFAVSPTGMTDVTSELPLPSGAFFPVAEDVDRDNDVDIVLVEESSGRARFLSSHRGWNFADETETVPSTSGRFVTVDDLTGTGFVDFATFGDVVRIHVRGPVGAQTTTLEWPLPDPPTAPPIALDWDLDGTTDLLWATESGGVAGLLAPGFAEGGTAFTLAEPRGAAPALSMAVLDLDTDHDHDLLVLDGKGLREGDSNGTKGLALELRGYKDNAKGVGAVVEIRQGLRYRRVFWDGDSALCGMGKPGEIDMIRITWPNGVIQSYFDTVLDESYVVWQRPGLVGSCPFLYVWNGETYEFISDVLGITPLGLPMAPGLIVPPDHDEYVLVSGEVMKPRDDGFYELQFTEELREVTYLDRIRLDVIDHPADVEIFPSERFTFPPFPEHHVHTVRGALKPTSAVDAEGHDWQAALSEDDMSFAIPFEPLEAQFQGLATPHWLELSFDPGAVRAAEKLRLVMNGWFYWTDASVNVAAARHSEVEFVPPLLQVPDGQGGWQTVGPPLGFPAGKLKTMVVDVTELLNREDPRLRVFSTLRLYWDSIRLAVDADDAPLVTTAIEPATADLWERGFSEPVPLEGPHRLEWFDWDHLAPEPRWNQHPGRYTRFGDTLPLVNTIDDRFVVMGAGDALTVRFDARRLPPLSAGWKRDFLVFLDGWAKDRDPNSVEALHVDPLPFHGMSSYPYPASERFPNDEEHRAWKRDWQTRPAKQWIPSVVPPQPHAARPFADM